MGMMTEKGLMDLIMLVSLRKECFGLLLWILKSNGKDRVEIDEKVETDRFQEV